MNLKICKNCDKRLEYAGYGEKGDNFLFCINEYKINYFFTQKEIPKDIGIKLYNFGFNNIKQDFDEDYVAMKINYDNNLLKEILKDLEFPSHECPYLAEHIVGDANGY